MKVKRVLMGIFGGWAMVVGLFASYCAIHPKFFLNPGSTFWMSLCVEYLLWLFAMSSFSQGVHAVQFSYTGRDYLPFYGSPNCNPFVVAFGMFWLAYLCTVPFLLIWAHYACPGDESRKAAALLIYYACVAVSAVSLIVFAARSLLRRWH